MDDLTRVEIRELRNIIETQRSWSGIGGCLLIGLTEIGVLGGIGFIIYFMVTHM